MTALDRSLLITETAKQMQAVSSELTAQYRVLTDGGEFVAGMVLPHQIVARALDAHGGVVCAMLHSFSDGEPTTADLPFLSVIIDGCERIFAVARDVAARLKLVARSGVSYVKRFGFKPQRLFSPRYWKQLAQRVGSETLRRERFIAHICHAIRAFFDWLRRSLIRLEGMVAADPMRPIRLGAYARGVVLLADRKAGIFALKAGPREGSRPFHILPTSRRIWEILRTLCETENPEGYVALEKNYGSLFYHTDKDNNALSDDYSALVRHIVPGPRKGCYRLEFEPKRGLAR